MALTVPDWPALRTAADAFSLFATGFDSRGVERLQVAYLDGDHRLLLREAVDGEPCRLDLPVRPVIATALALDARLLLIAHNHPSGDARPSRSDLLATRALAEAARPVGLRLADHLVFGDADCTSFRRLGLL
jgi:DNA repair protein RadC